MRIRCVGFIAEQPGRYGGSTHAEWFHGKDGLGDHNYPQAARPSQPGDAVDAIIDTIEEGTRVS